MEALAKKLQADIERANRAFDFVYKENLSLKFDNKGHVGQIRYLQEYIKSIQPDEEE